MLLSMRKFESEVQLLKYKILKQIAVLVREDNLEEGLLELAETIWPGPDPVIRCCIYKEHAIINKRAKLAISKGTPDEDTIEIIEIACDQCPVDRFLVTETCRGCLANKCMQACPKKAISKTGGKAVINQEKCIECGKCRDACPFGAIIDVTRPCKRSCHVGAIEIGENKKAKINREKCTNCGACVYNCPFGAITDRSEIVGVVKAVEHYRKQTGKPVYALVAPAVSSQFDVSVNKVINALRQVGFKDALEVALGADIVAWAEGEEFIEKVGGKQQSCLLSSCCPAFVAHIANKYPQLLPMVSSCVSPMIAMGRFVKSIDPAAVTVFIGPCTAKKTEVKDPEVRDAIDYVMSFEELESLIDAYEIDLDACEDSHMNNASPYGRLFAGSGGVSGAVQQSLEEHRQRGMDCGTELHPVVCNGIKECDRALLLLKMGKLNGNFIEGMACAGGCIGGAVSLTHGPKDELQVKKYASEAMEKDIQSSLRVAEHACLNLHREHKAPGNV